MFKFFVIFVISARIIQDSGVDGCNTGEIILSSSRENGFLEKTFIGEYSSKGNTMWNVVTGSWRYHLKNMHEYDMYKLCECVLKKVHSNVTAEVITEIVESTLEDKNIHLGKNVKTDIPVVVCHLGNKDAYLIEGYRNNGLKKAYDIYVLAKKKENGQDIAFFEGLVRTVDFRCTNFEDAFKKSE